jgi:hypothetical protein
VELSQQQEKDIQNFLDRLPESLRINWDTSEFLNKEIRKGTDLNALQRENLFGIVRWCIEQKVVPPTPLESYFAYTYQDWSEAAKQSDEIKKPLTELVRLIKGTPEVTARVGQGVQQMLQERENRRREHARVLAAMAHTNDAPRDNNSASQQAEPPNVLLRKIQSARLGIGENPVANLDLAAQLADEAVEAYPNSPKLLMEAAGCHQILAEKGKGIHPLERYVQMRQAFTLYQRCYDCLASGAYGKLKGDYDKWRSGLAALIVKIQEELQVLEEKQR